MKTFWDLEEKERAALTREEVERFLDAELMTKGVLKVAPLVLDTEPETTEPASETFYQVGPIAFSSAAAADSFLRLLPVSIETKYLGGGYRNSISIATTMEREVVEKRLVSEREFDLRKSALEQRASIRAANEKRREQYDRDTKAQDKVLAGVWEDWNRCRDADEAHRRVVSTFNDYVTMADGDAETAARFLAKVFTIEAIDEARKWCGVYIPATGFAAVPDGEFEEVDPAPRMGIKAPGCDVTLLF